MTAALIGVGFAAMLSGTGASKGVPIRKHDPKVVTIAVDSTLQGPPPCYIALSYKGGWISNDAAAWEHVTIPEAVGVASAANTKRVVAVGEGIIATSADGRTWGSSDVPETLNAISVGSTEWVAVGDRGVIRTSPDGITWTLRKSHTTRRLESVATDGSHWVAVGNKAIVTSTDGKRWRRSRTNALLSAVAWNGERWLAVGDGVIADSSNGTRWAVTKQDWSLGHEDYGLFRVWPSILAASPDYWVVANPFGLAAWSASGHHWHYLPVPEAKNNEGTLLPILPWAVAWDGAHWVAVLPTSSDFGPGFKVVISSSDPPSFDDSSTTAYQDTNETAPPATLTTACASR